MNVVGRDSNAMVRTILPNRAWEVNRSIVRAFCHVLASEVHRISTSVIACEELQVLVVRFVQPRDAENAFSTPRVALGNPIRCIVQDDRTAILG